MLSDKNLNQIYTQKHTNTTRHTLKNTNDRSDNNLQAISTNYEQL